MSTTRWRRIEEIFERACELQNEALEVFLNQACAQDQALRTEIESLLAADRSQDDALRRIVSEAGTAAEEAERAVEHEAALGLMGTCLGPYKLTNLLGTGGMGSVYAAVRSDDAYHKEVAVKVVREGHLSPASHSRFLRERQALAELDHPYIARLLDGGTSAQGQPYLVMEKVDGQPLDVWCDLHSLAIRPRLELFLKIAEAVHDAHRKLVVHRDLKPANILVTAAGTPKLLDFGIAKILDPAQEAITRTERLLTPEYASPEQLDGRLVTTASDVYSLGVLLFEMLTGRRPFQQGTRATHDLVHDICSVAPRLPSDSVDLSIATTRGTTAERLRRALTGDLDTIVLMALRKEPERRYLSVEQFAADVRRYLDGLPVLARKDTLRYRLGKFVVRNRIGVGATAAILLVLLTSVVGLKELLDREQGLSAQNRLMSFSMLDMLQMDPDFGRDPRDQDELRSLLDRLTPAVDQIEATDPLEAAAFLKQLGDSYAAIGSSRYDLYKRRLAILLERGDTPENELATAYHDAGFVQKAYDMRLHFLQPPDLDLALSLSALAGRAWREASIADSKALHQEAHAMLLQLPISEATLRARFWEANQAAGVWHGFGDNPGALRWADEALAAAQELVPADDALVAEALTQRGWLLQDEQRFAQAEVDLVEAGRIFDSVLAPGHPDRAKPRHYLALLYKDIGRFEESESLLREAEAIQQAAFPNHPSNSKFSFSMARLRADEGRYAEAENYARIALELAEKSNRTSLEISSFQTTLGRILIHLERYDECLPLLETAYVVRQQALPEGRWELHKTASILGHAYVRLGRFEQAESLLLGAYEHIRADRGADHYRSTQALLRILELYSRWGELDQANIYGQRLSQVALSHPIIQANLTQWTGVLDSKKPSGVGPDEKR
jgi:eukaryotic-like serine/threonine-protein kinase